MRELNTVDAHLAGSDLAGDLVGVLDVAAVHASTQTKVSIVRYANSFLLVIIRLYRDDRSEDLFT
ncbi:hypothetical protein AA309_31115 [Microvirga vignae]|uniref:Uncharacterized protein n=1 Tax=Microvirga vignae TaxID=1225564 RepID=A0A0H1RA74_9HYPH|nr:hypothetical protein AA309_31115 [Microvirga vignae]